MLRFLYCTETAFGALPWGTIKNYSTVVPHFSDGAESFRLYFARHTVNKQRTTHIFIEKNCTIYRFSGNFLRHFNINMAAITFLRTQNRGTQSIPQCRLSDTFCNNFSRHFFPFCKALFFNMFDMSENIRHIF